MDLAELARHWHAFGSTDPLWAVLSAPDKRHGRWDPEEFFESGRVEIDKVLTLIENAAGERGHTLARGRALDFGCGVGRLTQALCRWFDRCDGVDIAESMLAQAREYNRFDQCAYHHHSSADLSLFADDSFDFVYTAHVLQHMEPTYSRQYVDEFFRVLRPGGLTLFEMVTERVPGAHEPLPDSAFRAQLALHSETDRLSAGTPARVAVAVHNLSDTTLPASGTEGWFQVTVANHWLDSDGNRIVTDDGRAPLPHDLAPEAVTLVELDVMAPAEPGNYRLEVDCVQEGVGWFGDRGSTTTVAPIKVVPAVPAPAAEPAESELSEPAEPAEFEATMEMHGVPEAEVRDWITANGGTLLRILDWDTISETTSYDWQRRGFLVAL